VHNRLPERTVVYVRHSVSPGYRASKAPTDPEHAAGADLYRVEVDGFGKEEVVLEEAVPVTRAIDVRQAQGMQMVRDFLATSRDDKLKAQVDHLAALEDAVVDVDRRTTVLRNGIAERRQHIDELGRQLASMKGIHTAATLAASLQAKEKQLKDEVARSTTDLAALEEKQVLARIELREGTDELTVDGIAAGGSLARGD
jgi:hypothetical protein